MRAELIARNRLQSLVDNLLSLTGVDVAIPPRHVICRDLGYRIVPILGQDFNLAPYGRFLRFNALYLIFEG